MKKKNVIKKHISFVLTKLPSNHVGIVFFFFFPYLASYNSVVFSINIEKNPSSILPIRFHFKIEIIIERTEHPNTNHVLKLSKCI